MGMEQVGSQYTELCSMMRTSSINTLAEDCFQWLIRVRTPIVPSSLSHLKNPLGLMIFMLCLGRSPKEWMWLNKSPAMGKMKASVRHQ